MSEENEEALIPAGSVPPGRVSAEHRTVSTLLMLTAFVLLLELGPMAWNARSLSPSSFVVPLALVLLAVPVVQGVIWWRFMTFRPGGRTAAVWAIHAAIGVFVLLGIARLAGGVTAWFGMVLLIFSVYLWVRARILQAPVYRMWYDEQAGITPSMPTLGRGEVMASCPHCHALLAVRPDLLGSTDRCPHCEGRLVLPSTISAFSPHTSGTTDGDA